MDIDKEDDEVLWRSSGSGKMEFRHPRPHGPVGT